MPALCFDVIDNYRGPAVHMRLNGGYVANYMGAKVWPNRRIFRSGFTVANVAFDAATQLGAKQIVFIGQDLCYTDGKLHADGGVWDEEGSRKNGSSRKLKRRRYFWQQSIYRQRFYDMREILETIQQRTC